MPDSNKTSTARRDPGADLRSVRRRGQHKSAPHNDRGGKVGMPWGRLEKVDATEPKEAGYDARCNR